MKKVKESRIYLLVLWILLSKIHESIPALSDLDIVWSLVKFNSNE